MGRSRSRSGAERSTGTTATASKSGPPTKNAIASTCSQRTACQISSTRCCSRAEPAPGPPGKNSIAGDANTVMGQTPTHASHKEKTMSATALPTPATGGALHSILERFRSDPAYQGYTLLRVAFAVAPILFGIDKFANVLVDWEQYLAPWINDIVPGSAMTAMYAVGVVEILAGLAVALKPRYGAYLVAAWLGGIIVNLLTYSGYYDIALRDFGLMLGALTLARLAVKFDPPGIGLPVRR